MSSDEPKSRPGTSSDETTVWSESPVTAQTPEPADGSPTDGEVGGSAGIIGIRGNDERSAAAAGSPSPDPGMRSGVPDPDEADLDDDEPDDDDSGSDDSGDDGSDGAPGVATAPSPAFRKAYTAPVPPDPKKRKKKRFGQRSTLAKITEIPALIIMAFVIAVVIKTFLVQAFYIPSESMLPTLRVGDRVLVEKVGYLFDDVSRGDVVVFEKEVFGAQTEDLPWHQDARNLVRELLGLPTGNEEDYIKRVVAIGGDVIQYSGQPRRLLVNGERIDEPYIRGGRDAGSPALTSDDCRRLEMESSGKGCRVPAGTVFVMGDNRGNSEDSRVIGPVAEDKIIGKAFVIIWPPGDIGTL
jgi:signal peptidase I